jgi:hypothetical protein
VAERSELRSVAAAEGGSPQIIIYQVKYLKCAHRPKLYKIRLFLAKKNIRKQQPTYVDIK